MKELTPDYFFSLEQFSHKELFNDVTLVWLCLEKLYHYFHKDFVGKILSPIPSSTYLENKEQIHIEPGCVIEPGAFIRGPCWIGKNSTIRHGAYIRGYLLTGEKCVIGHTTEIKNSLLLNEAKIPHFSYVGDSLLGNHTNLGAGVKCANVRVDKKTISLYNQGEKIETGLYKFGCVVGDGSQIGCNSVLNPGTLVGKNVMAPSCANLKGVIASNSIVFSSCRSKVKKRFYNVNSL